MSFLKRTLGSVGGSLADIGKPPDLQPYAAERGLTYLGDGATVTGISGVNTSSERSNIMHGELPGGEVGALCHVKQLTGHDTKEGGQTVPQYSGHTRIAVRVPEAVGALQRFDLTNSAMSSYLRPDADQLNPKLKMKDFGFSSGMGWSMTAAPNFDPDLMQGLLGGDFGARLEAVPTSMSLRYGYGSLVLVSGDGYASAEKLDHLCQHLSGLGQVMRQAALASSSSEDFEQELPAPGWLHEPAPAQPKAKKVLGMTVQIGSAGQDPVASDRIGGLGESLLEPWRGSVIGFAQQSGLTLEDPLAYHQAFPTIPVPGHAYAVMRAPLESGATGRIAFCTEGAGGGPVAVICRVKESAPARAMPLGGDASEVKIAVNDGYMAAWLLRGASVEGAEIQAMSQQAWDLAGREGWLPA